MGKQQVSGTPSVMIKAECFKITMVMWPVIATCYGSRTLSVFSNLG